MAILGVGVAYPVYFADGHLYASIETLSSVLTPEMDATKPFVKNSYRDREEIDERGVFCYLISILPEQATRFSAGPWLVTVSYSSRFGDLVRVSLQPYCLIRV
jgi:hypothetical protein